MNNKKLADEYPKEFYSTLEDLADQSEYDFEALNTWINKMVMYLEQGCPDSKTHLTQATDLQSIFLEIRSKWREWILDPSRSMYLMHYLGLVLWTFQLSVCARIASNRKKEESLSEICAEISDHLIINFVLLRDNLCSTLRGPIEAFNGLYSNMLIYSIIRNFISFYNTYCLWFEDIIYSEKNRLNTQWENVRKFLRLLSNKSRHEYRKKSVQIVNLKGFDPLLEIDYEGDSKYQSKLGNKAHKYPLSILVMIRFLLRDQVEDFEIINQRWFSCNRKIFDQIGNVKIDED